MSLFNKRKRTRMSWIEVQAELDEGQRKNQETIQAMRDKTNRFHQEMNQRTFYWDMCLHLVSMNRENIPSDDWADWMMEENGACLPISIGPFIKNAKILQSPITNPLSTAEIKYVK